jgi:NAD-dependent deacetylase
VYELHGNIERNYCTGCGKIFPDAEIMSGPAVPRCPTCRSLIRPDVVWFGELLPADQWEKSAQAAEHCEVFFSIGTSAVVYPAASLPLIAKQAGAYVVEINLERTDLSSTADEVILGRSGDILPQLLVQCPEESTS